MITIFEDWQEGEISDHAALTSLCTELANVLAEKAEIEAYEQRIRNQLSYIVGRTGKAAVNGFGTLEITAPSVTASYDKKAIDDLIIYLMGEGHAALAEQIAQCRKESMRAGGLRITREKVNPPAISSPLPLSPTT